jgi:hypothetical protein
MTREQVTGPIDVMVAFKQGARIEGKLATDPDPEAWLPTPEPSWNWAAYVYRVVGQVEVVA